LLQQGRLREFAEWELTHQTLIDGAQARRQLRYAKSGQLDDQPYGGEGRKVLDLARDDEGRWRIAALRWEED
jgi:hypothetical protein